MLPGVVVPACGLPDVNQGDCCAVTIVNNRFVLNHIVLFAFSTFIKKHIFIAVLDDCRAPVAVGKAAVSRSEMQSSGMKGRGVCVLHTYKDYLWFVTSSFYTLPKLTYYIVVFITCVHLVVHNNMISFEHTQFISTA